MKFSSYEETALQPTYKNKLNKIAAVCLFIFLIIQPILDTIYLFDERVIAFFGISPSTIIRFSFIIFIALITFIVHGFTKKFWCIFAYGIITGVYFIFHCLNAFNFNTLNKNIADFSIISEAAYIFRFIVPALIIYIVTSIKITEGFFEKTITTLSATMSGMIVVTNIFCISLDSYTNERIRFNIFSWFTDAYQQNSFNGLASKAYFNFANMVSVLFCTLLPIVIHLAINKNPKYYLLVFLHSVAMLMLGTKTSTYGVMLVLIGCLFVYLFLFITKQQQSNKKRNLINLSSFALIGIIIIGVIMPVSPAIYRSRISSNYMENYDELEKDDEDDDEEETTEIDETEYTEEQLKLKEKLKDSGIMSRFYIKCYPFIYDMEFWEGMTELDSTKRLDSRFIEESMFIRIKEINNNPLDDWFGITYDRTSRVYNLERDTLYQYYSLGLIGVAIFIAPYFVFLIWGIVKCLLHFKTLCTIRNVYLLFSVALTLATGFYCGNTIDNPFANILFSFICAFTFSVIKTSRHNKEIN